MNEVKSLETDVLGQLTLRRIENNRFECRFVGDSGRVYTFSAMSARGARRRAFELSFGCPVKSVKEVK